MQLACAIRGRVQPLAKQQLACFGIEPHRQSARPLKILNYCVAPFLLQSFSFVFVPLCLVVFPILMVSYL
jgi:hypothetical protein